MPKYLSPWRGLFPTVLFTLAFVAKGASAGPDAPFVTNQPGDRTVNIGGSATFSPSVSGTGTTTYRWLLNGMPVTDETNLNLTISGCQRTDSGWYVLEAENPAGRIATKPAYLTVNGSPAGTIQFRNAGFSGALINSASGENLSGTTIELFAGTEPDRVRPTGAVVSVNHGYFIGDTIPFPSVAPSQTLFIQARLGNGRLSNLFPVRSGRDIAGGTLNNIRFPTVNWPAPVFLAQPQDTSVNVGEPLVLRVSVRGYGAIRAYWLKNGSWIPVYESTLALGSLTTVEGTATFTIPAVALEDAGIYTAVLDVVEGFSYSVSTEVNVRVVIPAAGRIDGVRAVGNQLQITGSGRADRVYTLESKTPGSPWTSRHSLSSPDGVLTFPLQSAPGDSAWFRLRSSN